MGGSFTVSAAADRGDSAASAVEAAAVVSAGSDMI
jgi:hypothetical protein